MTAVTSAAVSLDSICKQFGGFRALADVSLDFESSQIHALVGQNGAGKSTCLGIIAGRLAPSSGTVRVGGRALPVNVRPATALAAGVAAIYQELTIIPQLSALDNVLLASSGGRYGILNRRSMRRRYDQLCQALGVHIRPDAQASALSLADQQMLEIMRALSLECGVLLMDEPTAALSTAERSALFRVVHQLRDAGVTVLFVSHYLDEVMDHADTATVFRDGRIVETRPTSGWAKDELIRAMLGGELDTLRKTGERSTPVTPSTTNREVLRVQGLTTRNGVTGIDLVIHPGEIVGLGGLVGSGRTSLINALAGAAHVLAGRMWIDGHPAPIPRSPRQALRNGLCLLPEDRKQSGLVPGMNGSDNILLGQHHSCGRYGFLSAAAMSKRVRRLASQYDISERALGQRARHLSGGNQQKLLLARTGSQASRILLADEPTRGVDIGAKSLILDTLRRTADEGTAVLFASSELEEVAAVSDRTYVLRDGRIVAELHRSAGIDADQIIFHAFAHARSGHA